MSTRFLLGDVRETLRGVADKSVHCVVTSPPYFGLRDYGMAGQIGLEPTPDAYVAELVAVFREVRRVLRDDGTLWLNLGDSYAGGGKGGNPPTSPHQMQRTNAGSLSMQSSETHGRKQLFGLKPKDLIGIPWRVAFALQADGWYLRSDIIWHKPNPMPESVTDRPTKSHEYLFLLTKSERYYYDADAIAEDVVRGDAGSTFTNGKTAEHQMGRAQSDGSRTRRSGNKTRKPATERGCPADGVAGSVPWEGTTRNKRTVWTVPTAPFKGAHFATFPPALIEPCILAGCPVGGTVLDSFGGAGTTGLVADRLGRNAILCELNPEYATLAGDRITDDSPLFADVAFTEAVDA